MEDAHLPERQAERIRRDLRHHRFEALPDRGRADIDRHRAVRLEVEPRRLLRPGSAALDKAGDRDAVIAAVDLAALQRALFLPAELGEAALERLAIVAAVALGIDRPGRPAPAVAAGTASRRRRSGCAAASRRCRSPGRAPPARSAARKRTSPRSGRARDRCRTASCW